MPKNPYDYPISGNQYDYDEYLSGTKHPYVRDWEKFNDTDLSTGYGRKTKWGREAPMSTAQATTKSNYWRNSRQQSGWTEEVGNGGNAKGAATKAKGKFGMSFGMWAGVSSVSNMMSGDNPGTAIVKGFGEAMLWETAPWAMGAWQIASALPQAAAGAYNWHRQREMWYRNQHLPNFGGNYQDTQRALTMRQSAVQAIQGSKLNARSALGGEARILAQGMYRQNSIGY